MTDTVVSAFTASIAADAARPLITFYDDATGERTELSGATLGNWVAKSANLLRDGLGLGSGDVATVVLPPHWQTAAVLLGCWSAGLAVDLTTPGTGSVGFTTAGEAIDADDIFALALAPLGLPFRPGPPPGTLDYAVEVRGYGDHFAASRIAPDSAALADGTSHASMADRARAVPVPANGRVLIDAATSLDPIEWLVAPLMAGASLVLCRNLNPANLEARLATERATRL